MMLCSTIFCPTKALDKAESLLDVFGDRRLQERESSHEQELERTGRPTSFDVT
jgi:hypothetical protein